MRYGFAPGVPRSRRGHLFDARKVPQEFRIFQIDAKEKAPRDNAQ